jgi:tryptophanyl-tRNA synthetase
MMKRATHVPVGADQTQHLEFVRECATNFNHTYSPSKPILPHPETLISPAKRIMSLSDPSVKMSKSHPNPDSRILITDSPSIIKRKITKAVTDSINSVSYDPVNRPGVANLVELMSHFDIERRSPEVLEETCKGMGLGSFKELVARTISDRLEGVRVNFERIMGEEGLVEDIAAKGAKIARRNAEETMVLVREAVGL